MATNKDFYEALYEALYEKWGYETTAENITSLVQKELMEKKQIENLLNEMDTFNQYLLEQGYLNPIDTTEDMVIKHQARNFEQMKDLFNQWQSD